jgi:hypothetical protein
MHFIKCKIKNYFSYVLLLSISISSIIKLFYFNYFLFYLKSCIEYGRFFIIVRTPIKLLFKYF